MLSEYERLSKEAFAIHGPSALLLLQVGHFWELYWFTDEESKTIGADNASNAKDLLGLRLMGNAPKTKERPYKTGFCIKDASEEKITQLREAGYTVCLGEQVTTNPIKRELARFYGPITA